MKLKRFLFLFIFVCLFCTACNGDVTRDIRHAGFSVGPEFECKAFFPKDKDDTNYEKIKYMLDNYIINSNGSLYDLSLGQKFSNNENCKVSETRLKVKALYNNSIIKATDDKYYYITPNKDTPLFGEVTETDNSYAIYDLLLSPEDVIKVMTADSSTGLYYVLKTDGHVYGITVEAKDRDKPPTVINSTIVYNKNEFGGPIVDFNYYGDSINTFVKTANKVYRMRVTNYSECGSYADIACKYKMEVDPIFEKYQDRIIAYNGNFLITDYKMTFNVAN